METLARANPADLTASVVDTMRHPVLLLDRDLRVAFVNRAFRRTFGVTLAQTLGRPIYELGDGEWDIPRLRQLLERVLTHDEAFHDFEVSHDFASIGPRIMLLNGRQLDEVGILLAIEDVTARRFKEADQAYEIRALTLLQEMNTEALQAEDMTTLLNCILDKWIELHRADFGNIQLYDREAEVLRIAAQYGFQARFLEHFAEVDVRRDTACASAFRKAERVIVEDVEKEPSYAGSLAEARAAGYRAFQSTPLLTRDRKPLGMISTGFREPRQFSDRELRFTNLATRQSAGAIRMQFLRGVLESRGKALEASEERLRLATHVAGLGILDYDAMADVVASTPELYGIVGLSPDTRLDLKAGVEIIHPVDRERMAEGFRQGLDPRGPGTLDEEFRIKRSDNGETRWLHMRSCTHFSGEGEERRPVRATGVVLDITARMAAEAQAEIQRKEFARLMRVATLGELSGGIAHELNQPLASILANAQAAQAMLGQPNFDREEVAAILEDIVQEDSRAGELIRRVRKLLKKGERQSVPINLNELIMSSLRLLRSELVNRQIQVDSDLQTDLPPISGDPVELQQVLLNLIVNAAEAMASIPPLRRELDIASREIDEGYVRLSIRDHGPGMSPDELKRIHEPFFTTREGGLGLGLSICSTIIKSHGGELILSNAADGGIVATVSVRTADQLAAPS